MMANKKFIPLYFTIRSNMKSLAQQKTNAEMSINLERKKGCTK